MKIGFLGMLAIAFIVLKLCGVIDWSWAWVLAPIWLSITVSILALIVTALVLCGFYKISFKKAFRALINSVD